MARRSEGIKVKDGQAADSGIANLDHALKPNHGSFINLTTIEKL
jgi:hypothetical protein